MSADSKTLAVYDDSAAEFAQEWHDQPPPADLHDIVKRYFKPGSAADIGCGSGREVGWLAANGWAARGYDASAGLIAEAKKRYPDQSFTVASLPALEGIPANHFDNVLCETVIMHLPPALVADSVARMLDILKPGGVFYLSWRLTEGADQRDAKGRLYAAFDPELPKNTLRGTHELMAEEVISQSSR